MNKKIIQDFKKILKIPKKFDFSIRSRCQLCNYKSFKNFTNTSLLNHKNLFIHFPFDQCLKCGLIQQRIKFSREFHNYFYGNLYSKLLNRTNSKKVGLFKNSYVRGNFLYSKFKNSLKERKFKIFRCWLWCGGKLIAFQKHGWDVYGVDPDKILINFIKKKYKFKNIFSNSFEDIKFKKNYFDLIVVSGSLEHVHDLGKVMQKINLYAKESCLLFLDSKGYPYDIKERFFNINHHRLLGPTTIQLLANKFGFKKILCNYDFMKISKIISKEKIKPKTNLYYLGIKKKSSKKRFKKETFYNNIFKN